MFGALHVPGFVDSTFAIYKFNYKLFNKIVYNVRIYRLDILPTRLPLVLNILPLLSIRATRVPLGVNTLPSRIRYWVVPLLSRTNVVGLALVEPICDDPVVEQPTSI
jgi:hypothetical protein